MARAQGARAQMALAFETVYGTPPAGGFTKMPFASSTLGAEQPLLNSELLGYGRDPLAPIKDAVTADGDVVVPLDAGAFGFWLKAAFGDPVTTGTGPWTHEFRSGAWTLPSLSVETGMPEVPRYAIYSGCVLDQLSWQMQRSGLLTATARLVAQGEAVSTVSSAGTPAPIDLKRFGHFNGAITRNGAALGNVVSAQITYANNLDRIETIRADGRIDGADPSIAALTGSIEVRFPDNISRGARGGPERRTQIVELASGDEERNASWANSRRRYDVSYGIRRADDLAAVVAFFEARNGRLYGFRFKDWADHRSCLPSQLPSPTDQQIGTGDVVTTAFQLIKRYASGGQSWARAITKPVAGSVQIALNGVSQANGWVVDMKTGVVSFETAPSDGTAITAGFEFDVPVRFDSDALDVTLDIERLGSITSIPLLEIRR